MTVNTHGAEQVEIERLQARVEELDELRKHFEFKFTEQCQINLHLNAGLDVLQQTLLEVSHAQQVGAGWYTKGAAGLYQQVDMWVRKGQDAINDARNRGESDER